MLGALGRLASECAYNSSEERPDEGGNQPDEGGNQNSNERAT
jgi:hypothetical protein